jgi:serine/threonine protein kinase
MASSVRGTPQWMAPECHQGEPPGKASDVHSLGLTMWEVSAFQFPEKMEVITSRNTLQAFSGKIPYEGVRRHALLYVITVQNRRPERPASLTETAIWDIIQECWTPVAEERPSIQKVQGKLFRYTTQARLDSPVRSTSHC